MSIRISGDQHQHWTVTSDSGQSHTRSVVIMFSVAWNIAVFSQMLCLDPQAHHNYQYKDIKNVLSVTGVQFICHILNHVCTKRGGFYRMTESHLSFFIQQRPGLSPWCLTTKPKMPCAVTLNLPFPPCQAEKPHLHTNTKIGAFPCWPNIKVTINTSLQKQHQLNSDPELFARHQSELL